MTDSPPRLALSHQSTALKLGRSVLRVDLELPVGLQSLSKPERAQILRDKFAHAHDVAVALLVEHD